ncbi:MAG TPA: Nudix family hydrolase [Burkholderiales bacterium]
MTPIEVAVAVFVRADGAVLLARRPAGKVYAGYWEFPGGKVEPGEAMAAALRREIREELGADVDRAYPWITRVFVYPHATVRLHFHRVVAWRGEPRALEHDALSWQNPHAISVAPMLPANGPVLKGLLLPPEYAISDASGYGIEPFLARLEARLREGLSLVQVREKALSAAALRDFAARAVSLCRRYGARVLINADTQLSREVGADGVHLTSAQLGTLTERPAVSWCGASCHSAEELRRAERLGADFAVLGPVRATPTHPGVATLGWAGFRAAAEGAAIPVYALGGVVPRDLDDALAGGAHGLAMVRGAWSA